MKPLLPLAVAALLLPQAALADFEGVLDFKLTGQTSGTMKSFVGKEGIRIEAEMPATPEMEKAGMGKTFRMITLMRSAEPNTVYLVNPDRKTFTAVATEPAAAAQGDATYTVKREGKDKIAGVPCEKATLTSSDGGTLDVCIATDIRGESSWMRAFAQHDEDGLYAALRKAGLVGIPVRWSTEGTTMELVSQQKRKVPASTFEIPKGFQKTENPLGLSDAEMTRMREEAMREAMKNLPPEQQKEMEEMMKQQRQEQQGGQQQAPAQPPRGRY